MKTNDIGKRIMCRAAGILFSVVPVTLCILFYFPFWVREDVGCVLSGSLMLLLAVAGLPLYRYLKRLLDSPSVPVLWGVLFVLFFALSRIAHEMTVISFYGFLGNAVGAVFFRLGERWRHE